MARDKFRRPLAANIISSVLLEKLSRTSPAPGRLSLKQRTLQSQLKQSPDAAKLRIQLRKVLAYLGEKDAALAEGRRATELLPESKDAFDGPEITEGMAQVYSIIGNNEQAIELLDGLLRRPSGVTVPLLKLNPVWDPLRNEPKFQALLNS